MNLEICKCTVCGTSVVTNHPQTTAVKCNSCHNWICENCGREAEFGDELFVYCSKSCSDKLEKEFGDKKREL